MEKKLRLNSLIFILFFCLNTFANTCANFLKAQSTTNKSFAFPNSTYHRLIFQNRAPTNEDVFKLDPAMSNVLDHLDKMTFQLSQFTDGINSVFYPGVGSDAATAFRIFGISKTIIGLDANPFISPKKINIRYLEKPKERLSFEIWSDVNEIDRKYLNADTYIPIRADIVEVVITDLKAHYPDLVIHSVLKVITKPSTFSSHSRHATNGIISFSEYPGGPIREYIHIHLPLIKEAGKYGNDPGFLYLLDHILSFGFQGVIARGSMNLFHPPATLKGIDQLSAYTPKHLNMKVETTERPGFRAVRHLSENGGIFIDGDFSAGERNQDVNAIIFDIDPAKAGNEWIERRQNYKFKFGYNGAKLRILFYKPKSDP